MGKGGSDDSRDVAADAKYVMVVVTPGNGVSISVRSTAGAASEKVVLHSPASLLHNG